MMYLSGATCLTMDCCFPTNKKHKNFKKILGIFQKLKYVTCNNCSCTVTPQYSWYTANVGICPNQTLNNPYSCINRYLNKVSMKKIFIIEPVIPYCLSILEKKKFIQRRFGLDMFHCIWLSDSNFFFLKNFYHYYPLIEF
jgi:hypothetical protein